MMKNSADFINYARDYVAFNKARQERLLRENTICVAIVAVLTTALHTVVGILNGTFVLWRAAIPACILAVVAFIPFWFARRQMFLLGLVDSALNNEDMHDNSLCDVLIDLDDELGLNGKLANIALNITAKYVEVNDVNSP